MDLELTTTERLICLALRLTPNQTAQELQQATGTKTLKHLVRACRTLTFAGLLTRNDDGVTPTYNLTEASNG